MERSIQEYACTISVWFLVKSKVQVSVEVGPIPGIIGGRVPRIRGMRWVTGRGRKRRNRIIRGRCWRLGSGKYLRVGMELVFVFKGFGYVPVRLIWNQHLSLYAVGRPRVLASERLSSLCRNRVRDRLHNDDLTVAIRIDLRQSRSSRTKSASLRQSPIELTFSTSPPPLRPHHSSSLHP
jgi:hypothetical protein